MPGAHDAYRRVALLKTFDRSDKRTSTQDAVGSGEHPALRSPREVEDNLIVGSNNGMS